MTEVEETQRISQTSKTKSRLVIIILLAIFLGSIIAFYHKNVTQIPLPPGTQVTTFAGIKKFTSEAEFKLFISASQELAGSTGIRAFGATQKALSNLSAPLGAAPALPTNIDQTTAGAPERVSHTNVQVPGIDEPDIVKTDGHSLFISQDAPFKIMERGMMTPQIVPAPGITATQNNMVMPIRPIPAGETSIVAAFPVEQLTKQSKIDQTGDLLVSSNILIVLSSNSVTGFDLTDKTHPAQAWKFELAQNNTIVSSRLKDNKLYLVTQTNFNYGSPCPVPLSAGAKAILIPCTEIYHPLSPVDNDVTFTVIKLNPTDGVAEKTLTFTGKSGLSIIYMSPQNLFVTYTYNASEYTLMNDFYKNQAKELVSPEVLQKLEKLESYDISLTAKMTEFQIILDRYNQGLTNDEQLRIQTETTNRLTAYLKERSRELTRTGIVKINLDQLDVAQTGEVAGTPLNQFALDEYQGFLRVATTFGGTFWGFGGQTETASDVYTLDDGLHLAGAITNLGSGERIYAVRFISDRGYVVTFKQTDPFFVLDLSNPHAPSKAGELTLPGFSSYLHGLTNTTILGIGQENGKVKLALYDVTNPATPTEIDKYILDEYWTEVSNNHHVFLQDDKYKIFFLPGGKGGYIFNYSGNKLKLAKTVSETSVKRALFINDNFYVVADNAIRVFAETNWEEVNHLSFE